MAEGGVKKNKKRRHSQIDNDDEVETKVPKLVQSKPRAKQSSGEVEEQSPPLSEPDGGVPTGKDTKAKKKFKFPKRPVNKSWLTHISAGIICNLVGDAVKKKLDPRQDPESAITDDFSLPCEDVKKIWYYIGKEYSSSSLNDILSELTPLHKVTPTDIVNQETMLKYKDQLPKPPVTAYLQFVMSKQSKLKEKHPELGQVDVTRRLAQKWKEIGPERRGKYIQRYNHLKKQYQTDIEEFYCEHPDARPLVQEPRKAVKKPKKESKEEKTFDSEAEKRYKELKLLAPKPPVTAYFLFVSAKRGRYKDKHPNLKPSEVTKKLADKWHSLSADRQNKYKKVYDDNYKEYKSKLDEFYSRYPDAKDLFKRSKGSRVKGKASSATSTALSTSTLSVTSSPSAQTSPLMITTTPSKNSLQKNEVIRKGGNKETDDEEEEDENSSDSGSDEDGSSQEDTNTDSSSDEDVQDHKKLPAATKTLGTPSKTTPATVVRINHPVARKELKVNREESSSGSGSGSSDSDDDNSSDDD